MAIGGRTWPAISPPSAAASCSRSATGTPPALAVAARHYPSAQITPDYQDLLDHPDIHAIAIATPVRTHFPLAQAALLAGKDVLVEKPITATVAEAEELIRLAAQRRRILTVDHTFLFTGAVKKIKELVGSGELGQLLYIDSVRVNLGLIQPDVNVIYDLAPHDLSILCYLTVEDPVSVRAIATRHPTHRCDYLAYLHLEYASGLIAHLHLNWLAPVKIRRTLIGGTRKLLVYDDMEPSEKVKVYDKGIVWKNAGQEAMYKVMVDYRTGDMVAPKLLHQEALQSEIEHFVDCVEHRRLPLVDGYQALRVLRILAAAERSLGNEGMVVHLDACEMRKSA